MSITVSSSQGNKMSVQNEPAEKEASMKPILTNILDAIIHTLPLSLKAHQGFLSELDGSKASCNVCGILIVPIFDIPTHLKTNVHEDSIINAIKSLMPIQLQDHMKFVSFYDSSLYCNLCECKIVLSSSNLHESMVNIIAHNADSNHSRNEEETKHFKDKNEKSSKPILSEEPSSGSTEANEIGDLHVTFECLLDSNSLIKRNAEYIRRENVYVCKLCSTVIITENVVCLERSIILHIIGSEHNEKLKFLEIHDMVNMLQEIKEEVEETFEINAKKGVITCNLCDWEISSKSDNERTFQLHISDHLESPQHKVNKEEKLQKLLHVKDGIDKLFFKLPNKYLDDIEYFSACPSKKFISCNLCHTTIINPYCLKEHLEDLTHIEARKLDKMPNLLIKSEHSVTDDNVLNQLSSLSSLLAHIECKAPW